MYTASNPFFENADEIGGDIEALGKITNMIASPDGVAASGLTGAIIGKRKIDRGINFNAFINMSNIQVPPRISMFLGANTAVANTPLAATGQLFRYTPLGAEAMADRCRILLSNGVSEDYNGIFRVFLRCDTATANNFYVQLRIEDYYSATGLGAYGISEVKLVTADATAEIIRCIDMGSFSVKSKPGSVITINVAASAVAGGAGQVLDLYDVVLIPTDEFCCEYDNNKNTMVYPSYVDIDSISEPKEIISCERRTATDKVFRGNLITASNGSLVFSHERSRYWILANNKSVMPYNSTISYLGRISAYALQQYNSLRGAE